MATEKASFINGLPAKRESEEMKPMMIIPEPMRPPNKIRNRRTFRFKAMLVSHKSRLSASKFNSQMASIYTTNRIPPAHRLSHLRDEGCRLLRPAPLCTASIPHERHKSMSVPAGKKIELFIFLFENCQCIGKPVPVSRYKKEPAAT